MGGAGAQTRRHTGIVRGADPELNFGGGGRGGKTIDNMIFVRVSRTSHSNPNLYLRFIHS